MWVGGLATATAKHDDSNDVGNQDGVIEKDEVVGNGCVHEVGFNLIQSYPSII